MKRQKSPNLFGIIVILIGGYLLAYNLNLPIIRGVGLGEIFNITWPLLFVAWGVEALGKRNHIVGTILSVLGLYFFIENLSNFIPVLGRVSEFVWPLAIIGVGIYVMLAPPKKKGVSESDFSRSFSGSSSRASSSSVPPVSVIRTASTPASAAIAAEDVSVAAGDSSFPQDDTEFIENDSEKATSEDSYDAPATPVKPRVVRERSYDTSFNSRKLIFTEKDFQEGDNVLNLSVLFSDVALLLPSTISVTFVGTVTLGDVQFFGRRYDGISQTVKDEYNPIAHLDKHLIINATVTLGDLRIKAQ